MSVQEAVAYALELMRQRNFCEMSISRIIVEIRMRNEDLTKKEVETLVIGSRGQRS